MFISDQWRAEEPGDQDTSALEVKEPGIKLPTR